MSNRYQRVNGPGRKKAPNAMAVYEWIRAEVSAGRPFPTLHQIAARQGWSSRTQANDVLARLVRKGYLKVVKRELVANGWRYTYELREDVTPE